MRSIPRVSAPYCHLLGKNNAMGTFFSTRHLWPETSKILLNLRNFAKSSRTVCKIPGVTRWQEYLLISGHLQKRKMPKWHKMLTKAVSHFCPTLNERSHNCQRLFKYCQNGEISPNLAALFVKYLSGSYAFQLSQITFSSGARHSVTKRIKHFCPLPT